MPVTTRTMYLQPSYDGDGRLLFFLTPGADRRHPPHFIRPEHMVDAGGGPGWFLCESFKEGPWRKWRAVRRVDRRTPP